MTKKKCTLICIVLLAMAAVAASVEPKAKETLLPVSLSAVPSGAGWGYEIAVDGKLFIRQASVPAIAGNTVFSTEEDALLVGKHAVEKLKIGKLPQITVAELKEWGIKMETDVR